METKDFSKEPIRIGHVILWRKGWYERKCKTWEEESTLNDIREMLKYDGYSTSYMSNDDIYMIIFHAYDEYYDWAKANNISGWYDSISSITRGTYHNCYPENSFRFNMLLEILAKWAWTENKYLHLPIPHYDKHTYKMGGYRPGMTYAYMNKCAQESFNKKI